MQNHLLSFYADTMVNVHSANLWRSRFKKLNRFMVLLWRLGLGKWINAWPPLSGRVMVLIHTGRKSGKRYRTPVNYALYNEHVYCTAGFGPRTDWYQNICANPHVEVWLPDGHWTAKAYDVTNHPDALAIIRRVLIASGQAAPLLAGIHPDKIGDAALTEASKSYRVIQIERKTMITNAEGPGDLRWVWYFGGLLLAVTLVVKRRH